MDPQVIQQLLSRRAADEQRPLQRLTPRELEVLELMAQGRSNAAIAAQLVVTERAIAKHTSNIFAKLGLEVSDERIWEALCSTARHCNRRTWKGPT